MLDKLIIIHRESPSIGTLEHNFHECILYKSMHLIADKLLFAEGKLLIIDIPLSDALFAVVVLALRIFQRIISYS